MYDLESLILGFVSNIFVFYRSKKKKIVKAPNKIISYATNKERSFAFNINLQHFISYHQKTEENEIYTIKCQILSPQI